MLHYNICRSIILKLVRRFWILCTKGSHCCSQSTRNFVLDWYLDHTWLASQSIVGWHCINAHSTSQITLDWHSINSWSIVDWVSTDSDALIKKQSTPNQTVHWDVKKCQSSVNQGVDGQSVNQVLSIGGGSVEGWWRVLTEDIEQHLVTNTFSTHRSTYWSVGRKLKFWWWTFFLKYDSHSGTIQGCFQLIHFCLEIF